MADDVVEENEICFVQEISIDYRDGGEHYLGGSIIKGARREGYKEVYIIISYSKHFQHLKRGQFASYSIY